MEVFIDIEKYLSIVILVCEGFFTQHINLGYSDDTHHCTDAFDKILW